MSILDFKELSTAQANSQQGEDFEGLMRELGKRLELNPEWSGRGADQGRDLYFTEKLQGVLGTAEFRWLVSCKDFARSGRSVAESDVGAVTDKVRQHGADGFLLATTTIASSGLKAMLDGVASNGEVKTAVWDRHELENMLVRPRNNDLLKRFFPQSYSKLQRLSSLPQALKSLEALTPPQVYSRIVSVIESFQAGDGWFTGKVIWPFDHETEHAIDDVLASLRGDNDPVRAAEKAVAADIGPLAMDVLLGMLLMFARDGGGEFCKNLIRESAAAGQDSLSYFRFYVTQCEPSSEDQISLASELSDKDLRELYSEEIEQFISQQFTENPAAYAAWSDLDTLSSHSMIEEVYVSESKIAANKGNSQIEFKASVQISVSLEYDGEVSPSSPSFPGEATGHISAHGMFLDKLTVDTSSFYGPKSSNEQGDDEEGPKSAS